MVDCSCAECLSCLCHSQCLTLCSGFKASGLKVKSCLLKERIDHVCAWHVNYERSAVVTHKC